MAHPPLSHQTTGPPARRREPHPGHLPMKARLKARMRTRKKATVKATVKAMVTGNVTGNRKATG